jgi:hypothetical protein
MLHRYASAIAMVASALIIASCSKSKPVIATPSPVSNSEYIDLQPEWRLRVVTPLGKTGDYKLKFQEVAESGNQLTLRAADFGGYETSYYSVEPRRPGVRVRFASAEVTREGVTSPATKSVVPLFTAAARNRYVRLVYLTRVSTADHNMAVISCEKLNDLEALTRAAQANDPVCGKDPRCSWIPAGIAVRPELKRPADGTWAPAR